ncbi:NUDIX domain-containing protein [Streptomyces sp. NPDC018833]|uniref:NUDIX domain-containing protein n=1 Tax=Streptomyces sp. NPDC018833 TaxID=3365053 RepID=UPI0037A7CB63
MASSHNGTPVTGTTRPGTTGATGEPENASVLIFNDTGEYLLHLRDHVPGIWEPGSWSLLGGGREPGDGSLEQTARRELLEETGLVLPVLEPFLVKNATDADGSTVAVQIYEGRWNGDPDALRLTEGVMLRWFRPEIMPRLRLSPSTLELVRHHAEGHSSPHSGATVREGGTAAPHGPAAPGTASRPAAHRTVPNVIGVHLYLENPAGEVLLGLRHPDSGYAGRVWHFLAGHCEQESSISCLVREAREEAGLVIRPQDAEFAHAVHLVDEPGRQPRMQLVFRVRRWEGQPQLREPDKCLSWKWWDPHALPARIVPYTRAAIAGILAGRHYTELGWS